GLLKTARHMEAGIDAGRQAACKTRTSDRSARSCVAGVRKDLEPTAEKERPCRCRRDFAKDRPDRPEYLRRIGRETSHWDSPLSRPHPAAGLIPAGRLAIAGPLLQARWCGGTLLLPMQTRACSYSIQQWNWPMPVCFRLVLRFPG